ncbi:MAG: lysylphosphatidylglycerol synthase transmembrane domain-containing protein [Spirosomataceae bacterium]
MSKKIIRYSISLVVAGSLMWWVFKDIDLAAMFEQFKKADYRWIIVSALLAMVAHWSRAYRWCMLMEPMGYKPSVFHATLAVWVGYFANFILPRMGEVTRCGSLQQTDGIPFEKSFGTVVAERIFDVITLLVLIALNFLLEFDRLSEFFLSFFGDKLQGSANKGSLLLLAGGGLVLLVVVGWFVYQRFQQQILANPVVQKIVGFLQGLLDGLLSIRKLRRPWLFIFHSVLIWTMYYFMSFVLFWSIPETAHLSMLAGLTVLVVGAIGTAAPTQGGIGAYHVLVGNVMVLYGLTKEAGITLATFIHGSQMVTILFVGAVSFLITLFVRRKAAAQ